MLDKKIISGIQQVGIGVSDVHQAWAWYHEYFGMDIRIFEDAAVANLMVNYTGGEPRKRNAALAMNLSGGGGFEIWQFADRMPVGPRDTIQLGDLGLYVTKIKSADVKTAYSAFKNKNQLVSALIKGPDNLEHFFVKDPYQNIFQVVEGNSWFTKNTGKITGAVYGNIIGVSDIENARRVYSDILGYDTVVYDTTGVFEDFKWLPGGDKTFRRVLLKRSQPQEGPFSNLLGTSIMELVQVLDRAPVKIFKDRFWGDLGFIHLCFDIKGMDALRKECKDKGFPFTVDSSSTLRSDTFDMGEAAGHFAYIEDPDGTMIEFVETDKIPVIKKLGWYLDLRKRNPKKQLSDWVLKSLKYNKVKNPQAISKKL